MISAKTLARFFVYLVVFEALLVFPWPGWRDIYRSGFVSAGNLIFEGMFRNVSIKFQPGASPQTLMDVDVIATNRAAAQRAVIPMNSRHVGWMATAFGLALSLATPVPWRRRTWAAAWMLTGTSALAMVRAWFNILLNLSNPDGPSLLQISSPVRATAFGIHSVLNVPMIGWYVVPLLIWLAWLITCGWNGIISQGELDQTERYKR